MKRSTPPVGATAEMPEGFSPEAYDEIHAAAGRHEILWRLSAEAYGDQYPYEIQPFGMTTWWTLGQFVAALRIGPQERFVDLACGRGGPGLWVARATGAELIGVDWSAVAVKAAQQRASDFVAAGRARFQVGTLTGTRLPDACADAVLCADAIFFATDRVAAVREVGRVLRPAGRFVFTAFESDADQLRAVPDWTPIVEAGGLVVESKQEIPQWSGHLQRMYDLWLANLDALGDELGEQEALGLAEEAQTVGPLLAARTGVLVTARLEA